MARWKNTLIAVTLVTLVGGCGFRPLYGTNTQNASTVSQLQSVEVTEQTDRRGQLVRNEIISNIHTSGTAHPRFRLNITPQDTTENAVELLNSDVVRKSYRLRVRFSLTELKSGKTVLNGTTFSHVPYDRTTAPFSNYQAKIDAQERAAREVGSDISTRLAAYFASS